MEIQESLKRNDRFCLCLFHCIAVEFTTTLLLQVSLEQICDIVFCVFIRKKLTVFAL